MNKICSCGRKFFDSNLRHDKCRGCNRKRVQADAGRRQVEARRVQALQLQQERGAEQTVLREALRQALLAKQLPKSAAVIGDRGQVVVKWMGRSHTFHLPSSAFA